MGPLEKRDPDFLRDAEVEALLDASPVADVLADSRPHGAAPGALQELR